MSSEKTTSQLSCKEQILKHLKDDKLTLGWISRKTGIAYGTLYSVFIEKRVALSQERLNLINHACKTDFKLDEVPAE